ncbi:MAG: BACON domain-containing protein [Bacteroidaceae bacterium]|nr:BACON domain-containing protein [Bacteroidaceae bacterium]
MKKKSLLLMPLLMAAIVWTGCSSSDEPEIPTQVENPTKVVQYEQSTLFQSDLDAFVTYAFTLKALRQTYWNLLSNNFEDPEKAFTVLPDEMEKNSEQMQKFYEIVEHVAAHADEYQEAIEHLDEIGILEKVTETRGWIADGLAFIFGCKQTEVMGRASVMAIIRESGWATDTQKLSDLFYKIPEGNRRGYSDPLVFWNHFSKGKLDSRANVIFDALYHGDPLDFGTNARDLGLTPGKNVTKAGAMLIEKGMNLVIDASPISTQIGYGKDLFSAVEADLQLKTNLVKWNEEKGGYEFNGEVLKNYLQTSANNFLNYGVQIKSMVDGGEFEGWDLFSSDEMERLGALGLEFASFSVNEQLFSDNLETALDRGDGQLLIPNAVTITAADGTKIPLVIMTDQKTGEVRVGLTYDKDGNVVINPGKEGEKFITALQKGGKHVTKPVKVDEKPAKVEVEFQEEEETEEIPKNPELVVKPASFYIQDGNTYNGQVFVITNYLYYSVRTDCDWLSAKMRSECNWLNFLAAQNTTGKERVGHITVMATAKDGKVLATTTCTVTQAPYVPEKAYINAFPAMINMGPDGGKQFVSFDYTSTYPYIGAVPGDDLIGWGTVTPYEDGYMVQVKENSKEEERSGTVTFYAAVSSEALDKAFYGDGKLDPAEVVSTTVVVKQGAGEDKPRVREAYFYAHALAKERDKGSMSGLGDVCYFDPLNGVPCEFNTTVNGNDLHVECSKEWSSDGKRGTATLSLDIQNFRDMSSSDYKIMNLKFNHISVVNYGDGDDETINDVSVTNIPIVTADKYELKAKGTVQDGVIFNSWTSSRYTPNADNNYVYVERSDNTVEVRLYFR